MRVSQKCSIAVHCLVFINEYGQTTNVNSSLLAKSTGCNPVIIRNIISALSKKGLVSVRQGVGNIRLAKEPEEITMLDVYTSFEDQETCGVIGIHSSPSKSCPVGRNIHGILEEQYEKIEDDMKKSMAKISLDEIIASYHQAVGKEKS